MLWRNFVAKYSLLFIALFIIIYTIWGTIIYRSQQDLLIDISLQHNLTETEQINAQLTSLRTSLISIGMLTVVLMILFSYFLSRRLSRSLKRMVESTKNIIAGKYDTKLPILSHDELGEFSMSFNRMSRQLGNQFSALSQEKEILFSVIGSMKDGVITMNLDGDTIISNREAEDFMSNLKYESNQVDKFNHYFQSVITEKIGQNFKINLQGRDWEIVFSPLHKSNKIQGVVAILRDVTEEEQLNQFRETFIANVSHELRTPISLIHGYSEAIIDEVTDTVDEQRDLAKVIYEESDRLGRLVTELLDLTKLKSGHLNLRVEKHPIKPFLEKIERKFTKAFNQHGISFIVRYDGKPAELKFDYDRLEQVLTNLIDNAIKHTPENGEITLEIIDNKHEGIFTIKDTGSGIANEDLPFVFEQFYMADKYRAQIKKSKKGTGLGLSLVIQIIEAHEGTISVQSKLGEGTIFKFNLPK